MGILSARSLSSLSDKAVRLYWCWLCLWCCVCVLCLWCWVLFCCLVFSVIVISIRMLFTCRFRSAQIGRHFVVCFRNITKHSREERSIDQHIRSKKKKQHTEERRAKNRRNSCSSHTSKGEKETRRVKEEERERERARTSVPRLKHEQHEGRLLHTKSLVWPQKGKYT